LNYCCPTNPVLKKCKALYNGALQIMKCFPDMTQLSGASLLPLGEGQDEGINEIGTLRRFGPLTPTLSRREREFMGQQ